MRAARRAVTTVTPFFFLPEHSRRPDNNETVIGTMPAALLNRLLNHLLHPSSPRGQGGAGQDRVAQGRGPQERRANRRADEHDHRLIVARQLLSDARVRTCARPGFARAGGRSVLRLARSALRAGEKDRGAERSGRGRRERAARSQSDRAIMTAEECRPRLRTLHRLAAARQRNGS